MRKSKKLIFFLVLIIINFSLNAKSNNNGKELFEKSTLENNNQLSKVQTVYICTGAYAYAYHSRSNCPGLNNCKGEIKYTDEYSAVNSFLRKPCCRCWSNVIGNCRDDNPTYYGGDNSDESAYIALAILATSAIILSNDLYIYQGYSFYHGNSKNTYMGQQLNIENGKGWIFGFRKTFKHSALEYGGSYLRYEANYLSRFGHSNNIILGRLGWHSNFVHQVFYKKTPETLKVYLGPSINYVYDFGYGGIIGTELKLADRLKFDVRYEWTTQTNQIQAGFIFTYQKKYFWQK